MSTGKGIGLGTGAAAQFVVFLLFYAPGLAGA